LNPRLNRLWFETISHKGLRLLLPALHAILFVAPIALLDSMLFRLIFAGQSVFYGAALLGYVQRHAERRSIVFSIPCAICLLCWATVVGFTRFLMKRQQATWERVATPSRMVS
jgi:hypothetical protein